MPQIFTAIPEQSYELIRARIGEILLSEIAAQYYITANPYLNGLRVWMERTVPFSFAELPAVNVQFVSGGYDNQDVAQVDGTFQYFIDVYVNAQTTEDGDADTLANIKLQRILGICRAILMNPKFKTLGFAPPFIMNRIVNDVSIKDPGKQDATNSVMGRLTLQVKAPEDTELITPPLLYGFDTRVYLHLSDSGYLWNSHYLGESFDYTLNSNLS